MSLFYELMGNSHRWFFKMLTTLSQSIKKKFLFEILLFHEFQKSANDNFLIKKKILASFPSFQEKVKLLTLAFNAFYIWSPTFPYCNGTSQGVSPCLSSPALAKVIVVLSASVLFAPSS